MSYRPLTDRDDRPDSGRLLYGSSARLRLHRLGPEAWAIAEHLSLAVWSAARAGDSAGYWRAVNRQCDWAHPLSLNAAAVRDAVRLRGMVRAARGEWPSRADRDQLGWEAGTVSAPGAGR